MSLRCPASPRAALRSECTSRMSCAFPRARRTTDEQPLGRAGLLDEVVGAVPHGVHGHRDVAVAGDHDHRQLRLEGAQIAQPLDATAPGQLDVAHDDSGTPALTCACACSTEAKPAVSKPAKSSACVLPSITSLRARRRSPGSNACHRCSPRREDAARGNSIVNSALAGARLRAFRLPPNPRTMWAEIIRPRPRPLPRASWSRTVRTAAAGLRVDAGPRIADDDGALLAVTAAAISMRRASARPMASIALPSRLTSTCSSRVASRHGQVLGLDPRRNHDASFANPGAHDEQRIVDALANVDRRDRIARLVREHLELMGQAPEAVDEISDASHVAARFVEPSLLPQSSTSLPTPAFGIALRSTVSMSIDTRPMSGTVRPSTATRRAVAGAARVAVGISEGTRPTRVGRARDEPAAIAERLAGGRSSRTAKTSLRTLITGRSPGGCRWCHAARRRTGRCHSGSSRGERAASRGCRRSSRRLRGPGRPAVAWSKRRSAAP